MAKSEGGEFVPAGEHIDDVGAGGGDAQIGSGGMTTPMLLDTFSGIGGFSLAGSRAGFQACQFVEIDPFCQRVLAKNFPGVPTHADICNFDARPFRGRISLLTGGFPCQPFSVAGKQQGDKDARFLWPELLRVITECRPPFLLLENVPNLRTIAADRVLSDLETAGYTAGAFVVGSDDAGNSHRRKRVWIVARMADAGNEGGIGIEAFAGTSDDTAQGQRPTDYALPSSGDVAHANGAGRGEREREQSGREFLPSSEHGGKALADAPQQRQSTGGIRRRQTTHGEVRDLLPANSDYPFPCPPRPDDFESWAAVAAMEPTLMPCSERENGLLADAVSARLVRGRRRTRNATLKALGNAIDPNVAYPFLCWIHRQLAGADDSPLDIDELCNDYTDDAALLEDIAAEMETDAQ